MMVLIVLPRGGNSVWELKTRSLGMRPKKSTVIIDTLFDDRDPFGDQGAWRILLQYATADLSFKQALCS